MTTHTLLKSVTRAMERIAPLRLAEKWDNVGLLLESPVQRPDKHRVLLTIEYASQAHILRARLADQPTAIGVHLDASLLPFYSLTTAVCSEAIAKETSVIVAYHPTIFKGLQALTLSNPLQKSLLTCAAEGISVYSPHTALDSVWGGINDWLAQGLMNSPQDGVVEALVGQKINPTTGESEGAEGRLVTLNHPIEIGELERRIKTHLRLDHLQVGYAEQKTEQTQPPTTNVRTIAICAGSGGSMLLGKQADVYFTGEMSHHEVLASVAAGRNVILCGHTNTERGYLSVLAEKLRAEICDGQESEGLTNVEIMVSQKDRDPLQIV